MIEMNQTLNSCQVLVYTPRLCAIHSYQRQRAVLGWSVSVMSLRSGAKRGNPNNTRLQVCRLNTRCLMLRLALEVGFLI